MDLRTLIAASLLALMVAIWITASYFVHVGRKVRSRHSAVRSGQSEPAAATPGSGMFGRCLDSYVRAVNSSWYRGLSGVICGLFVAPMLLTFWSGRPLIALGLAAILAILTVAMDGLHSAYTRALFASTGTIVLVAVAVVHFS